MLIFLNGLPIVLMELKNPADENATIWNAFDQLQTYKAQIPSLFTYNELLVISDGLEARVGSLTATTRALHALAHHRRRSAGARFDAAASGGDCRACWTSAACWISSATSSSLRTRAAAS